MTLEALLSSLFELFFFVTLIRDVMLKSIADAQWMVQVLCGFIISHFVHTLLATRSGQSCGGFLVGLPGYQYKNHT